MGKSSFEKSFVPTMTFCQYLDLKDYFDLDNQAPLVLSIYFEKVDDIKGVNLLIEERNKRTNRAMKSLQSSYSGQLLEIRDLDQPQIIRSSIKISLTLFSEKDPFNSCQQYPSEEFESFGECDNFHASKYIFEHYGLIPFWTIGNSKDFEKATKWKYDPALWDDYYYTYSVDGTLPSDCTMPCLSTNVS